MSVKLTWLRLVVCGLIACCLIGCQTHPLQLEPVKVVRIVSGQTIEVLDASGQNPLAERVRLLGIEAPDWKHQQPWSDQARQQLETLIGSDRTVWLESDVQPGLSHSDGSQLRLAYVWQGKDLLNERLVEGGYVLAHARSPNLKYEQRLAYAQEKARLLGVGIWNPNQPMRHPPE